MLDVFLQSAVLESTFDHDFLFVVLPHVLSVIRMLEDTLEDVYVELV